MKKYLLCFGLLGLYAGQARAVDTVFSDAFVAHLDKCEPFADSYSDYVRELKTQTTSTILGKRINGDCEVEIETQAENNMRAEQHCLFDAENLEQVVNTLRRMRQRPQPQDFSEGIAQSVDEHAVALSMLLTTSCDTHYDEVDNTADIRQSLESCTPLTMTESQGRIEFVRKVVGMEDNKCVYELEHWQKAPDLSRYHLEGKALEDAKKMVEGVPDVKTTYHCVLDIDGIFNLTEALSKMVMPAYGSDDLNDDIFDSYNPSAELEFVGKNCQATQEMIEKKK
jgi:hypothetical protein